MVMMFAASFYVTWLFFAVLYYITCYFHGDLLEEHLPHLQEAAGWTPCVLMIDGFAACFLFSLETQHTIGYGSRQTTTECPETMFVASVQSVLGCLIQAFMVGLVFSKLSRPGSRSKTVIFSQNAVVTLRNRRLCLIFRIGDLRDDNFILGTQISANLVRRRITQEGELYEEMQPLKVDPDSTSEPCIFFVWPLEVVHIIDEDSPFFDLSAAELAKEKFEITVVMEGCIETTSMNFQARTSYLPGEILWGHRFEPMMLYRKDNNKFQAVQGCWIRTRMDPHSFS
jgi:potassium inwardly-rectifying channel subfamily J